MDIYITDYICVKCGFFYPNKLIDDQLYCECKKFNLQSQSHQSLSHQVPY